MTAFADTLDLQTAVVDHVGREDIVEVFPRLVRLAEAQFNNRLRCWQQIKSTTITSDDGGANFPSDFVEVVGLYDAEGYEYVQQPVQNNRVATIHRHYYSTGGSGSTTENQTGDFRLEYYATIPTIAADMGASNWLLQLHPALYLYGTGFEAAKHLAAKERDQAEQQRLFQVGASTQQALEQEFRMVGARDHRARYSRARVRVSGPTP